MNLDTKIKKWTLVYLYNEKGIILPVGLILLVLVALMGAAASLSSRTDLKLSSNLKSHTEAFYAAEGGLAKAVAAFSKFASAPTTAELATITAPVLANPDITFTAFSVQQLISGSTAINGGPYNGLNATETIYLITSEASLPGGSRSRLTLKLGYMEIPLFQFGAFYGEGVDFEIYAGPPMTFSGRVHANSDMYFADSGSNGMFFDSYVTSSGKVHRYRKDEACCKRQGNPQIKDGSGVYQPLDFDHEVKDISDDGSSSTPSDEDYWTSEALDRFDGRLMDSSHKIIPPIPELFYDPTDPDVVSHQLIEKGDVSDTPELKDAKLYYQADLIIEEEKAYDPAGNEIKLDLLGCFDADGEKAVRKETFYDAREEMDVEVTQIDIGALTACGVMPANGIVYASEKPGKPEKGQGVRLVNGAELPTQGLTVVSGNPVYIQGDYNTINKVPAAVMGDAITVLSNNWGPNNSNDSDKAQGSTSSRRATETTINAAFATGPHAEASPGAGNGEFNNLPRFLEDWRDVDFNYRGSMISLWHSQLATGAWRCCGDSGDNYYVPPNRNWGYDTLFDTQQPPGTPKGIVIIRLAWAEVV